MRRRNNPFINSSGSRTNTNNTTFNNTTTNNTTSNNSTTNNTTSNNARHETPHFHFVNYPDDSSSSDDDSLNNELYFRRFNSNGRNTDAEELYIPYNQNEANRRIERMRNELLVRQEMMANNDRNNERIFIDRDSERQYNLINSERERLLRDRESQRNLLDRNNERYHQQQLSRIQNIENITNAQLRLNQQLYDQQMARRNFMIRNVNNNTRFNDMRTANLFEQIAPLFNCDLSDNNRQVFISRHVVEDISDYLYQYSMLFTGVQDFTHEEHRLTIYFVNNQMRPYVINLGRGWYVRLQTSTIYRNVLLVRFHKVSTDKGFNLECPNCDLL